jgi:KipI family sensor histidine kinase inhibitor
MMKALIEPLGDSALLIQLGERVDAQLNLRTLALAAAVHAAQLPGIRDIAPAYASICVRYDLGVWEAAAGSPFERIRAQVSSIISQFAEADPGAAVLAGEDPAACLEIPVCYDADFGPDLEHVAQQAGFAREEVVARHCAAEYRVAMLGFAPGFPYLLGLDPALNTPRRATPRTRVPAGSVAIGGAQTGIYPRELPGGWHLIGRTPLVLFDPARDPATLLRAGLRVRFRAIDAGQFAALAQ